MLENHYAISSGSANCLRIALLDFHSSCSTVCTERGETNRAVMNTWVEDWNEKRIDDLTKLYYSHGVLLPADGSRAEGQSEIRASLQKQIGAKVEVRSLGLVTNASLAYENGAYTQTTNGQSVEGNYLVVLIWEGGKWLIIQQAWTVKQRLN